MVDTKMSDSRPIWWHLQFNDLILELHVEDPKPCKRPNDAEMGPLNLNQISSHSRLSKEE